MRWRGVYNVRASAEKRKELRKEMTLAEVKLWGELKGRRLEGKKFRRQHGLGKYIVDFYCPECRLIVELDGAPHFGVLPNERDARRTRYLEGLGYRVIRFENYKVIYWIDFVLEAIRGNLDWWKRE